MTHWRSGTALGLMAAALLCLSTGCASSPDDDDYYGRDTPRYEPYPNSAPYGRYGRYGRYGGYGRYGRYGRY